VPETKKRFLLRLWKHLEAFGSIWKHLEAFGSIWKLTVSSFLHRFDTKKDKSAKTSKASKTVFVSGKCTYKIAKHVSWSRALYHNIYTLLLNGRRRHAGAENSIILKGIKASKNQSGGVQNGDVARPHAPSSQGSWFRV
jgi:hypothetical protein